MKRAKSERKELKDVERKYPARGKVKIKRRHANKTYKNCA